VDKSTRNKIERLTQDARRLLEQEFREQLEGEFDILLNGAVGLAPGSHLSEYQRIVWEKIVSAVAHKRTSGLGSADAVAALLRDCSFTTLNRFVALKMLEARGLVQECVTKGEDSGGFKEFTALAPGLAALPDRGYRLYIETLFDEVGQEVGTLFDRRDVAGVLWPRQQALQALLGTLDDPEIASVWAEDETIGWVYQYFNGGDERSQMRAESQAPRNSRELAVRNQFFTPRYVVQFLTDNTLGRTWYEMMRGETKLAQLDYLTFPTAEDGTQEELSERPRMDPREICVLDPACGSGHFLLYAFDLLATIYEEAWNDPHAAAFAKTEKQLRADYASLDDLKQAIPELILRHNLHGIEIDLRAAQIAALALWMRAQRAYNDFDVQRSERPPIRKTNIVVAEPMPDETALVDEFAANLKPPALSELFRRMVGEMKLAGELGSLLKIEETLATAVSEAAEAHKQGDLFVGKLEERGFWDTADEKIIAELVRFAESAAGGAGFRRRLFADDAAQGVAFVELMRKRFDVVLMNPPFGAGSLAAKKELEKSYPRTKNDIYAAFVERGIQLLHSRGMLGAITSRTGFFLSSFQKWREEILLKEAPPVVFADLGHGVLDSAMVEVAAYCLQKSDQSSPESRACLEHGAEQ
jgi:Eco57I restriction-modification methylase